MSATTTAVKECPILFSDLMVRAILEGRKTQTRRVVKPQPPAPHLGYMMTAPGVATLCGPDYPDNDSDEVRCPYGQPGDHLWVRETWGYFGGDEYLYQRDPHAVAYRADHNPLDPIPGGKWRPSIHMPRWASRITLEIVSVRVERVQDISLDDCWAEGTQIPVSHDGRVLLRLTGQCPPCDYLRPIDAPAGETHSYDEIARAQFASLWDSINAKRGLAWAANPWVWVIDFRRTTP